MTIVDETKVATAAPAAPVAADPQPDVALSVSEQDAVLATAASETTPSEVPADRPDGEARAWTERASQRVDVD